MGLADRSSQPLRVAGKTEAAREGVVLMLRALRLTGPVIARRLRTSRSTVSRILRRHGEARLRPLEPTEPVRRYERKRPGELIHIDVKKLGRIGRPGHRVRGDRTMRTRGVGSVCPRVHRRCNAPRVRRGAGQRAQGDSDSSSSTGCGLVWSPRHRRRAAHDRQRLMLPLAAASLRLGNRFTATLPQDVVRAPGPTRPPRLTSTSRRASRSRAEVELGHAGAGGRVEHDPTTAAALNPSPVRGRAVESSVNGR